MESGGSDGSVKLSGQIWWAIVAILVVGGCTGSTTGGPTISDGTGTVAVDAPVMTGSGSVPQSTYVGPRWQLVEVSHEGTRHTVPTEVGAWIRFDPSGRLQLNDGVNAASGGFTATPEGFRRTEMASTLVGYAGSDPVRLAVIDGMGAVLGFGPEAEDDVVSARMSSERLVLGVDGYELSFERPIGES